MRCPRLLPAAFALAIGLLFASRAQAQNVTIDFEDLSGMNFVDGNPVPDASKLTTQYLTKYGVTFDSGGGYAAVVQLGTNHATSGVNGIGGSTPDGLLTYSKQYPITIRFFDPTHPNNA